MSALENAEWGIDPFAVVLALRPMLVRLAGDRVLVSLVVVRSAARLALDPHRLEQLIIDLVLEAIDGVREGWLAIWVTPEAAGPGLSIGVTCRGPEGTWTTRTLTLPIALAGD